MAADNDLDKKADTDIANMCAADLELSGINLVIQHDPSRENIPTSRFRIERHNKVDQEFLGETNCGDPKVLKGFLECGMKRYPARRTITIIWSHGTGAEDNDVFETVPEAFWDILTRLYTKMSVLSDDIRPSNRVSDTPPYEGSEPAAHISALSTHPENTVQVIHPHDNSQPARMQTAGIHKDHQSSANRLHGGAAKLSVGPLAICPDHHLPLGSCPDHGGKTHDYLTNKELGEALTIPGKKIDILVFDACLMNMVEVVYEIRDHTGMIIGSEATIPAEGLPLVPILKCLDSNPNEDNTALAKKIAELYKDAISGSFRKALLKPSDCAYTLSAVRTDTLESVAAGIDAFAEALIKSLDKCYDPLQGILHDVQKFGEVWQNTTMDYIDLSHFVSLCSDKLPPEADIKSPADNLLKLLDETVVCNLSMDSSGQQIDKPSARGLSIYFPPVPPDSDILDPYRELEFNKQHQGWLNMINAYVMRQKMPD
jgi:hypothetical protein